MGWNSYDYYDTTVNEEQIKANADFMAANLKEYGWEYVNEEQIKANADFMAANLKEYGWEYVVVDIQWYANGAGTKREQFQYIPFDDLEMDDYGRLQPSPARFPSSAGGRGFQPLADYVHSRFQYIPFDDLEMDDYGRLQPSPARFPSSAGGRGFQPLADYVHSRGLKFGIHIMRGIPRKAAQEHLPVYGSAFTADMTADPASICGWNPDMYGVRNGIHIMRGIPRKAAQEHLPVYGSAFTADMTADPASICGWNPDMYGVRNNEAGQAWYDSLIEMYAQWGVDFIKCDDICDSWLYRNDNFNTA